MKNDKRFSPATVAVFAFAPAGAEDEPMINGEFHFGALDRGMFHACLDHPRDVAKGMYSRRRAMAA